MGASRRIFLLVAVVGLLAAACGSGAPETDPASRSARGLLAGVEVELHKAVGCGCCEGWQAYVEDRGAVVDASSDPDVQALKVALGLPEEAWSCHTAIVDGYAVEGHVPAEAVVALLEQRPDAVGLAVPGMPGGSPGMGGDESTWASVEVFLVGADGSLTPFDYRR